jgi:hypothetical protein
MLACSPKAATSPSSTSTQLPRDMSTYANIDAFITKHLVLDLTADFDSRTLLGTAELMFERRDPGGNRGRPRYKRSSGPQGRSFLRWRIVG